MSTITPSRSSRSLGRSSWRSRPTWGAGVVGQTTLTLDPLTTLEATEVVGTLLAGADAVDGGEGRRDGGGEPAVHRGAGGCARVTRRATAICRPPCAPRSRRGSTPCRRDARTALLHASVIGQSFWSGVLDEIGELGDVETSLEALEARGLVRRHPHSQVEGDVEFAFKHVLIRDVAYATLPRGLRRELHAADGAGDRGVGPRSDGARMGPGVPLARRRRAGPGDRVPPRGR